MAKGAEAKSRVVAKLKEAFGDAFLGEMNGKYYVESKEDGETIQVAINLTCPKVLFEKSAAAAPVVAPTSAFGPGSAASMAAPTPPPADIGEEERANVNRLIAELGL
jgi:hypothetical protein